MSQVKEAFARSVESAFGRFWHDFVSKFNLQRVTPKDLAMEAFDIGYRTGHTDGYDAAHSEYNH